MTSKKFSTGAFVFTRTRGLQPKDPAELEPVAIQHGIALSFIPTYPGDRVAITRAISHASRGLTREGILLRPIKRTSTEVVYGIVQERKDESHQRLDHDFEDTVAWTAEPDPSIVTGDHDVAGKVREAYDQLRGKIIGDDWSSSITAYLETHDAARMRGDGRVYWVPPQRIEDIKKLGAFLSEVGIDLIMCEIEPEVQTVVQDVAQVSLDEELDRLQEEADSFDGRQKPGTYVRRLEEYQKLRQRASLYRDALGVGADKARAVLDELEQKVSDMLTIRRQTVIHRDGSVSAPVSSSQEPEPNPAPVEQAEPTSADQPEVASTTSDETTVTEPATTPSTTPPCADLFSEPTVGTPSRAPTSLIFAGAQFILHDEIEDTITYVSDDEAAKASVLTLESMGLAGSWQKAGQIKINIQNSGPEGVAVSLRFQLPEGRTLIDSATSLATWGIELAV